MKSTIAKKAALSFVLGAGFILTFLPAQFLLIAATGVELSASIASLGEGHREVFNNPMLLGTAVLSMIITGGLVMLWAVIKGHIAPAFGLEKSTIKFKASIKRVVGLIVVLFLIGVFTSLIFGGFNEYIGNLSPDVELRSLNSLYDAILAQQPVLVVWTIAAIIVFGVLVSIAGALYKPVVAKVLPNDLK